MARLENKLAPTNALQTILSNPQHEHFAKCVPTGINATPPNDMVGEFSPDLFVVVPDRELEQ